MPSAAAAGRRPPQPSHASLCSLRESPSPSSLSPDPRPFESFDDIILAAPSPALTSTHYDPEPSPLEDYASDPLHRHQRSLTGAFFETCRPLVSKAASTLHHHTSRSSPSSTFHASTKSLASFFPSRDSPLSSWSESNAETADGDGYQHHPHLHHQPHAPSSNRNSKLLANWFSGSSAPIRLGISQRRVEQTDEDEHYQNDVEPEDGMAHLFVRSPARSPSKQQQQQQQQQSQPSQQQQQQQQQQSGSGALSWIANTIRQGTSSPSAPSTATNSPNPSSAPLDQVADELLTLDFHHALFPHGPADPLDPSSFNDLLSAAEAILTRYQTAYRRQATILRDTRAELSAQDDELDEAETRARHLKQQLDDMAARAAEQDTAMQALADELMAEKMKRQEEEAARLRSLSLVRGPDCRHHTPRRDGHPVMNDDDEEEDDATPRRNPSNLSPRESSGAASVNDSGFESGGETDPDTPASSVFSARSRSATTVSLSSSTGGGDCDLDAFSAAAKSPHPFRNATASPTPMPRRSTFDKVLRRQRSHTAASASLSPLHHSQLVDAQEEHQQWGCVNCQSAPQAKAWAKVAEAREQNLWLRRRVEELETAVDGALDVVAFLGH